MKIGLISRARTCTSAIGLSLAHKFELTNFGEDYLNIGQSIGNLPVNFDLFKRILKCKTDTFFQTNNFVCKLWPSMIIYKKQIGWYIDQKNFSEIKNSIIFDLSYFFNIKKYDQLYFLDRDLLESLLSFIYVKKTKIFHQKKNFELGFYKIIQLDKDDLNRARWYILEYVLQQKIKNFLIDNNVNFIDTTNNVSSYIDDSNIKIKKSEIKYKSLIQDYQQLETVVLNYYPICLEETKDWIFY